MKFSEILSKLADINLSHSLINYPDCDPDLESVEAIEHAANKQLSYIEGAKFARHIHTTNASALILPPDPSLQSTANQRGIAWIASQQPRLLFAQVIALFYQPCQPTPHIHPTAIIDPSAAIGKDTYIGAYAVIGAKVKLGNGTQVYPHVTIYPQVEIGEQTILHANCTIHERSRIGANCIIHSGAVIGAEGFGFVPTAEGWYKMQQSGYTILEDGVEIGCNSTVDRPAVGETRIRRNTKLDNLVHIAHGCDIGENCAVAAQVGLAGGVRIGKRVILAGQVGIANDVKIGDGAIATAQTGITGNVKAGAVVSGSPAVSNKLYRKVSAIYKRLPEIYQIFRQLKQNN